MEFGTVRIYARIFRSKDRADWQKKGWWSVRCRALDNDARRESTYRKCRPFYRPVGLRRHVSHYVKIKLSRDASQIQEYRDIANEQDKKYIRNTSKFICHAKLIQIN